MKVWGRWDANTSAASRRQESKRWIFDFGVGFSVSQPSPTYSLPAKSTSFFSNISSWKFLRLLITRHQWKLRSKSPSNTIGGICGIRTSIFEQRVRQAATFASLRCTLRANSMIRPRGSSSVASSRATAQTLCQKCLKKDESLRELFNAKITDTMYVTTATNVKPVLKSDRISLDRRGRNSLPIPSLCRN